jgi:NADH:ubiquinone oxidoreductase subunit B-like Fe-S oxidoreductase
MGGIDTTIPVAAYIPGCPVRPEAIIDGVIKLLEKIDNPEPLETAGDQGIAIGGDRN